MLIKEDISDFKDSFEPKLAAFFDALIFQETDSRVSELWEAVKTYVLSGGKRIRPFILAKSLETFGIEPNNIESALIAFELLHNSTLADNDIIDRHTTRRGEPTLPVTVGGTPTMLISQMLHARARLALFDLDKPFQAEAVETFGKISLDINRAQLVDLQTVGHLDITPEALIQQIEGVAAHFIELMFRLGAPVNHKEAMTIVGKELGIVFQLVDDLMDIDPSKSKGRPVGDDIRQGKTTPLLLHAYRQLSGADAQRFESNFGDEEIFDSEIVWMIQMCHSTGAVNHVLTMAQERIAVVRQTLDCLGEEGVNLGWIYDLCDYSVQRTS